MELAISIVARWHTCIFIIYIYEYQEINSSKLPFLRAFLGTAVTPSSWTKVVSNGTVNGCSSSSSYDNNNDIEQA